MKYLALFLFSILVICWYYSYSIDEGFNNNNNKIEYKLPLNVYVVSNMNLTVTNNSESNDISSTMTVSDANTIIKKSNEKFFNQYGIEWIPTYKMVSIPNTDEAKSDVNRFNTLQRPSDDRNGNNKDHKIRRNLFKYIDTPKLGTLSLYFITFLGHSRQGLYTHTKDGDFIFIGQYSNKKTESNSIGNLTLRELDADEGIPSMTFTVVHELAHALGLTHLNTNEPNVMNGMTSSFTANESQIKTMKSVASEMPAYTEETESEYATPTPSSEPNSNAIDTSVINTTENNTRKNRPGLTSSVAYINCILDRQSKALCNRSCGGSLETFTNLHSYSLYSRE